MAVRINNEMSEEFTLEMEYHKSQGSIIFLTIFNIVVNAIEEVVSKPPASHNLLMTAEYCAVVETYKPPTRGSKKR